MFDLITGMIVRICIITAVFSLISYFLFRKYTDTPSKIKRAMPLLFVLFGVVILINVLIVLEVLHPLTSSPKQHPTAFNAKKFWVRPSRFESQKQDWEKRRIQGQTNPREPNITNLKFQLYQDTSWALVQREK